MGKITRKMLFLCIILCGSSFSHALATFEDSLSEIFVKNLYEDYKSRENESLTENLQFEIKERVEIFQNLVNVSNSRRKREATEESGVYIINGFDEAGSVPVNYPIDICLFQVRSKYYVAVLHREDSKDSESYLKILRSESGQYTEIFDYKTYDAEIMDCINGPDSGFVAVINKFGETEDSLEVSSPIFRITDDDRVELVLRFAAPHQNSVHFWTFGNSIFLSHTFIYPPGPVNNRKQCPIYKWTGHQFILTGQIKCFDSYHMEHIEIDSEVFLVVANYKDDADVSDTFSFVYKFDVDRQTFTLHQKIFTNAAHDIRHFTFEFKGSQDTFLMVENAYKTFDDGSRDYRTESVIYKYVRGYFVPFQSLVFDNVTQVLPVVGHRHEFILLVATENREVVTFQYDGWKFVEAPIDYAKDAFGKGVRSMRCYNQFGDRTLIAIANENNYAGETAFYFPLYKLKNDIKTYYQKFMEYADGVFEKYQNQNLEELLDSLKRLPSIKNKEISVSGRLELADTVIHNLETYALYSPRVTYNSDLVAKISHLKIRINKLRDKLLYIQRHVAPHMTEEYVAGPPPRENSGTPMSETTTRTPSEEPAMGKPTTETPSTTTTPSGLSKNKITDHFIETSTQEFRGIPVNSHVKALHSDPSDRFVPAFDRIFPQEEDKFAEPIVEAIPLTHENVLIVDGDVFLNETLHYRRINGHPGVVSDLFYPELNLTCTDLHVNLLGVTDTLDGIEFSQTNLLMEFGDQVFHTSLELESTRTDYFNSPTLNGFSTADWLRNRTNSTEMMMSRAPKFYNKIVAEELYVDGFVNNVDIRYFDSFLMKGKGHQVLEAPVEIGTLKAKDVRLHYGALSGKTGAELVSTKAGMYRMDQDWDFVQPVDIKRLHVTKRLNSVTVQNGRLQILLNDANFTQVVRGHKTFEHVKLTSPIIMQDELREEMLEKTNPMLTYSSPVYLEGDYEINGNAIVKTFLESQDIQGRNPILSVHRLREYGLPLSVTESSLDFTFTDALHVNHMNVNPSESFNPDDFVKTGTDDIQYVTGYKTFTGDVKILDGYCEAVEINKVDLNLLEANILKKHGNQVVRGAKRFNKITTKNAVALSAHFGQIPFSNILTLDSEQEIPKLTIKGPTVIHGIESRNLFPRGTFNNYDLDYLMQDTVVDGSHMEKTLIGEKVIVHVDAESLEFARGGRLNGIAMGALGWDMEIFSDRYLYVNETMYLQNPLKIKNLKVDGAINGIHSEEFGSIWLLSGMDQTFTEPVIVNNVEFMENVNVDGACNGYNVNYLYENTLWTDRDEVLGNLDCEVVSSVDVIHLDGTCSGLKPSTDFLLKNTSEPQVISQLTVTELNAPRIDMKTVNQIDFNKLKECSYLETPQKIKVLGTAVFHVQPQFAYINDISVEELYESTWLAHRNTVLRGQYHFSHSDFATNIVSTGHVNGFNLEEIAENYFSLTKPQDIQGMFYFANGTICHHLTAESGTVGGKIRGLNKEEHFIYLEDFDKHVLKKGLDQEITGIWSVYQVNIKGSLNNVKINNLTFANDVVRYDYDQNHISGEKFLDRLYVENLICAESCIVQDVDIMDWMANSITTYGNFTVQSLVIVENVTVFSDLQSFGTVNNVKFDEFNIMLKHVPQKIEGDVVIRSKFPHENRIVPVYFENLEVETINGRRVNDVLKGGVLRSHSASINGSLDFTSKLTVANLYTDGHSLFGTDLETKLDEQKDADDVQKVRTKFVELQEIGEILQSAIKGQYLSHIRLSKGIEGTFTSVLSLVFEDGNHRLAIFDKTDANLTVQFYKYDGEFKIDDAVAPLKSKDMRLESIQKVKLHGADYLILEGLVKGSEYKQVGISFEGHVMFKVWEFNSTHPRKFEALSLNHHDCIVLYSDLIDQAEISCLGPNGLFLYQILEGAPISQVVTLNGPASDSIAVLTADGNIVVYDTNSQNKLSLKQSLQLVNPSVLDAICYRLSCYLGIVSEKTENAVHHGSVEIYRNLNGSDFTVMQTINIRLPKQVKFTKLSTGDILLYVLTKNPAQPVIVYQYSGIAGFKEFVTSTTIPQGKDLTIVKVSEEKEYAALLAEKEVYLIEPMFNPL